MQKQKESTVKSNNSSPKTMESETKNSYYTESLNISLSTSKKEITRLFFFENSSTFATNFKSFKR